MKIGTIPILTSPNAHFKGSAPSLASGTLLALNLSTRGLNLMKGTASYFLPKLCVHRFAPENEKCTWARSLRS